jgi:hypothetical protein
MAWSIFFYLFVITITWSLLCFPILAAWDVRTRGDRIKWWFLFLFSGPIGASLYTLSYSEQKKLKLSFAVFIMACFLFLYMLLIVGGVGGIA